MKRNVVEVPHQSGTRYIVAVCAFCGRWRDSLDRWWEPPKVVEVETNLSLLDLMDRIDPTHTYCADCLRENSDSHFRGMGYRLADREDARARHLTKTKPDEGDVVLRVLEMAKETP